MAAGEKRRNRPKLEADSGAGPKRLDLAFWPLVPMDARPRDLVFDALHAEDVDALKRRGYNPILLVTLPRRNAAEQQEWRLRVMQGVTEGTVVLDKSRSEGLYYDLKTHGHLDKRQFSGEEKASVDPVDLKAALNWGQSRHTFAGNTTLVPPEEVAEFVRQAEAFRIQKENAPAALEAKLPADLDPEEDN